MRPRLGIPLNLPKKDKDEEWMRNTLQMRAPTESSTLLSCGAADDIASAHVTKETPAPFVGTYKRDSSSLTTQANSFARLGIDKRTHWVILNTVVLFIGKGVLPFVNDAIHATQTSLTEDPALNIGESTIGQLSAVSDLSEGLAKLAVAPALLYLGPRIVWLFVLGMSSINVLLPALTNELAALYNLAVTEYIFLAWAGPATMMVIAGWVDGHQLGRAIGFVSVASKVTPSVMYLSYGRLMNDETELDSWTRCFRLAALLLAVVFVLFAIALRSSAESLGFRTPSPPSTARGAETSHMQPPLTSVTSYEAFKRFICMPRTWALMAAFSLLVVLKGGAKFASIYAKHRLGASNEEGARLQTTYAVAASIASILGGCMYDALPGGKMGIGTLMTSLNVLNLGGFVCAFVGESRGSVTMGSLYTFMAVIGFASVPPVSLVFAMYSVAVGGVKHVGTFVASFEFVAHFVEAGLDLWVGEVLEKERFALWLGVNCCIALLGTFFMALFYYLEAKAQAPTAEEWEAADSTLTNAHDGASGQRPASKSVHFANTQAE